MAEPVGLMTPEKREHVRRKRIRLAALKRHAAARGRDGKSELAVAAGRASARGRHDDEAWGLEMALRRWHPRTNGKPPAGTAGDLENNSYDGEGYHD